MSTVDPKYRPYQEANAFFTELRAALASDLLLAEEYQRRRGFGTVESAAQGLRGALTRKRHLERRRQEGDALAETEFNLKMDRIRNFVKQRFPNAPREEHFLIYAICRDFETGDVYYGESTKAEEMLRSLSGFGRGDYHLGEFLRLGIRGVRRRLRMELCWGVARMIWPIARSIVAIAIALGIFGVVSSPFETIAVSVILLIYATVSRQQSTSALRFDLTAYRAQSQFLDVRTLLGQPASTEETRSLFEQKGNSDKSIFPVVGNYVLFAVDMIAFWHLVTAVGWI